MVKSKGTIAMQIAVQPNIKPLLIVLVKMRPERLESLSLDDLADEVGYSKKTVKRHLKVLRGCGLVAQSRASGGYGAKYKFTVHRKAYGLVGGI